MARHKIPVHLETPDTLLFGLTARQTAVIGLGIALSYITISAFWRNAILLGAALVLAGILVIAAIFLAFVKPKNRTLDAWLVVIVNFWLISHHYAWRPLPSENTSERSYARRVAQAQEAQGSEED